MRIELRDRICVVSDSTVDGSSGRRPSFPRAVWARLRCAEESSKTSIPALTIDVVSMVLKLLHRPTATAGEIAAMTAGRKRYFDAHWYPGTYDVDVVIFVLKRLP